MLLHFRPTPPSTGPFPRAVYDIFRFEDPFSSTKKSIFEFSLYLLIFYLTLSLLLTKYYSGDQIKNNGIGWTGSTYGEERGAYRVLVGTPEGKRPPGRQT